MDNSTIVKGLNDLLARTYDAELGFKKVRDKSNTPALRAFFSQKANQRYDFGHQIKDLITRYGGEINKGGTLAGDVHRTWIDIVSAFTGQDDESILEEVARGEETSLDDYNDMLDNDDLPTDVRNVLEWQRNSIERNIYRVEMREDVVS